MHRVYTCSYNCRSLWESRHRWRHFKTSPAQNIPGAPVNHWERGTHGPLETCFIIEAVNYFLNVVGGEWGTADVETILDHQKTCQTKSGTSVDSNIVFTLIFRILGFTWKSTRLVIFLPWQVLPRLSFAFVTFTDVYNFFVYISNPAVGLFFLNFIFLMYFLHC